MKQLTRFEAAHCIDGKAASQVSVRIGSSRFDSGGRVVGVNNIFTDNYRPSTVENDIGIETARSPC